MQGDRDSVGVLQQRPSQGWGGGVASRLNDVTEATTEFLAALVRIKHWQKLPLAEAVQKVQISADGSAYAQHEDEAQALADALQGHKPAAISCTFAKPTLVAAGAKVVGLLRQQLPVNHATAHGKTVRVPGAGLANRRLVRRERRPTRRRLSAVPRQALVSRGRLAAGKIGRSRRCRRDDGDDLGRLLEPVERHAPIRGDPADRKHDRCLLQCRRPGCAPTAGARTVSRTWRSRRARARSRTSIIAASAITAASAQNSPTTPTTVEPQRPEVSAPRPVGAKPL